jgi:hypothetical protein
MKKIIALIPLSGLALCMSLGLMTSGCLSFSSSVANPEFLPENDNKKREIELNIDKGSLFDIVPVFAEWLDFDYIIFSDTANYKPVTVILKGEYTKRELWDRFLKVLEASKAKCTVEKRKVRIYPVNAESP